MEHEESVRRSGARAFDDRDVLGPGGHFAHARGEGVAGDVADDGQLRQQAQNAWGKQSARGR
jgi:hypothetical protein